VPEQRQVAQAIRDTLVRSAEERATHLEPPREVRLRLVERTLLVKGLPEMIEALGDGFARRVEDRGAQIERVSEEPSRRIVETEAHVHAAHDVLHRRLDLGLAGEPLDASSAAFEELDRRERKYGPLEYSHNEVQVERLPDGRIVMKP